MKTITCLQSWQKVLGHYDIFKRILRFLSLGIPGQHLYSHIFSNEHEGVHDITMLIIDKTDVRNQPEV